MRSGDAGDADGLADYPEGRGGGRETGLQIHAEPLRHRWTWHRVVCDQPGHNTERSDGKKKNKSSTKNISQQFNCRGNSNGPEKGRSVFLLSSVWCFRRLSHTVNIIWIINVNAIITALYSTQNKTKNIFSKSRAVSHFRKQRNIQMSGTQLLCISSLTSDNVSHIFCLGLQKILCWFYSLECKRFWH